MMGLLAGGCRLAFVAAPGLAGREDDAQRLAGSMAKLGGQLLTVQSEKAAMLMAAGAAMAGARAAALVADGMAALGALSGLDDLPMAVVDVSGRLPLHLFHARLALAPHTPQAAFEAGRDVFAMAEALRGPAVLAGLEDGTGEVVPATAQGDPGGPVPIYHAGPDDAEILLVGAGPGFEACARAREQLEIEGVAAAHLHLLQVVPFPAAITAPALSSARRVLIVEPGGPGTLAGWIRSNLGAPAFPFGELPRLGATPLGPDEIIFRAREVMAL